MIIIIIIIVIVIVIVITGLWQFYQQKLRELVVFNIYI